MIIKEGYDATNLEIKIGSTEKGTIQFWIYSEKINGGRELLSFMTFDEVFRLKLELEQAIKDVFRL